MMRVRVLLLEVRRWVESGRARVRMTMMMRVRRCSCGRTRRRRSLTRHIVVVRRHRLGEPLLQLRLHFCAELNPMARA